MGRLANPGLLNMLALTGVSPVTMMSPQLRRKHLRNDICISCLEKIPDGRPGRKCKKCRNPMSSVELIPTGKTLSGGNDGKDASVESTIPNVPSC